MVVLLDLAEEKKAVANKKRLGRVNSCVWIRESVTHGACVTQKLSEMQSSHLVISLGTLYVLTKMSKCPLSRADVFVDQIVFYVRVRKVNLNKWIFNDPVTDLWGHTDWLALLPQSSIWSRVRLPVGPTICIFFPGFAHSPKSYMLSLG